MTEYADSMKRHLAEYKQRYYRDLPDGVHRNSGRAYQHILPLASQELNIVPAVRDSFWAYQAANKATLPLHTDFHHLNSSQAFAFNVFHFWMQDRQSQKAFLSVLGVDDAELDRWSFEHIPDQAERTTFDFYGEYAVGARLLVEVKLTEAKFGQAVDDDRHREKRIETYLPRLAEKVNPDLLAEPNFFLNYQLFRNLSHLDTDRGDRLVLMVPRANAFTWSQALTFVDTVLPECKQRIHVVAVEDLIGAMKTAAEQLSSTHREHVAQLREKYLLGEPTTA